MLTRYRGRLYKKQSTTIMMLKRIIGFTIYIHIKKVIRKKRKKTMGVVNNSNDSRLVVYFVSVQLIKPN